MPGKCQGDIDAENDPAVIAAGEKAYWKAWDAACKAKVIERLRNHEEGARFHRSIYPNMTQDEQADLIERGEWRIIAPIGKEGDLCAIWADETREEAQNPAYLAKLKEYKNNIATRGDRIIY